MEVWRATKGQKSFGTFLSREDLRGYQHYCSILLVQIWKLNYKETSWSWQLGRNKDEVVKVKVRLDGAPTHFYKNLLAYCRSKENLLEYCRDFMSRCKIGPGGQAGKLPMLILITHSGRRQGIPNCRHGWCSHWKELVLHRSKNIQARTTKSGKTGSISKWKRRRRRKAITNAYAKTQEDISLTKLNSV